MTAFGKSLFKTKFHIRLKLKCSEEKKKLTMSQWTKEPPADHTSCLRTNVKHLFEAKISRTNVLIVSGVRCGGGRQFRAEFLWHCKMEEMWRKPYQSGVHPISVVVLPLFPLALLLCWSVFFVFYHFKFYHALFETNYSIIKLP